MACSETASAAAVLMVFFVWSRKHALTRTSFSNLLFTAPPVPKPIHVWCSTQLLVCDQQLQTAEDAWPCGRCLDVAFRCEA